jgi:hypothetical protein
MAVLCLVSFVAEAYHISHLFPLLCTTSGEPSAPWQDGYIPVVAFLQSWIYQEIS